MDNVKLFMLKAAFILYVWFMVICFCCTDNEGNFCTANIVGVIMMICLVIALGWAMKDE